MSKRNDLRDSFTSRAGFVLACIGSAVGVGNIWRFPNLVSTYGGMTFLIPYFFFVILVASSGIIEEFSLGRIAKSGPVGAFGWATEQRGNKRIGNALGIIPVLGSLALAIGYTVVLSWIIKYTVLAISGGIAAMGQDMNVIGGAFNVTADTWGANPYIIIAIVISFIIMSLGISGGIEKANKIMMPLLFGLFIFLAIYISFLPGASNGYKYILTFNPQGLLNPNVWIYAFGQAFFSLSVAGNGSVIYGSYLKDSESIPTSALHVAFFDTLAALVAAFVIIPAMATSGEQLSSGGPGLMFIYLVNVFNGMAVGRFVSIVFFICVLFAGVSSIINLYEAPVEFVQETFKFNRKLATAIILIFGGSIALCIQHITSKWMDVVSIYVCPLGALLAAVMFFWVIKKDVALKAANLGAKRPVGNGFYYLGKYVFILFSITALIAGAILGGIG